VTQTVEDFFAGGVTAAKFEDRAFGTVIGGEIVDEPRMQQQRDYESGEPMTYPDGNPAMQLVVVVQAYAPSGDDDGRRAFYVKGQMRQAVGEALRKHNEKAPRRGGQLWIKYTEDKPTTLKNGRPGNPQKIYAAKYEPPSAAQAAAYFDAAPTTSTPGGGTAVEVPAGVDPNAWARMTPEQQAQMRQALGATAAAPAGGSQFRDEPPF